MSGAMAEVIEAYRRLLAAGELKPDFDQQRAVALLDRLATELHELPSKGSILWRLAGKRPKPPAGATVSSLMTRNERKPICSAS